MQRALLAGPAVGRGGPAAAGREVPRLQPVHSTGLLTSRVYLPRIGQTVPREIHLADPNAALRVLSPLLSDGDRAHGARDFLNLARDRFAAPFKHLLGGEGGFTVSLFDTPGAYREELGGYPDGEPPAGASVSVALQDIVHCHAFVGDYLTKMPKDLAEWFVGFLSSIPLVIGPAEYRGLIERWQWSGEQNELCQYSDYGDMREMEEWEKLSEEKQAICLRALELGDRGTLEKLLKPGFLTLRAFESRFPAWALDAKPLKGNQTRKLEAFARRDRRMAEALGPFFPEGDLVEGPYKHLNHDVSGSYLGIAFWRGGDDVAHTYDMEHQSTMEGSEGSPYFVRIDLKPEAKAIARTQAILAEVLEYCRNVVRIFHLLEKRDPKNR